MRRTYSFKGGQRGKFYRRGAILQLPVYLDDEVLSFLSHRAARKKVPLTDLVNELLKKEIAILETVK